MGVSFAWIVALVASTLAAPGQVWAQIDLADRYPATLDYVEGAVPREWTSGPEDVWELSAFAYKQRRDLALSFGHCHVVFGVHGTNVVWAVVLPDEPAPLKTGLPGGGEHVSSLWFRFHPALVGKLFPKKTVVGPGPEALLAQGRRIYAWKINASWQSGNQPVIPWKHGLVIDVETHEGPRRLYTVDTKTRQVKHEPYFDERALPAIVPTTAERSLEAFDAVWKAFDEEYPLFTLKPEVDWAELGERNRPLAAAATSTYETGAVLASLLQPLQDLHVWVRVGGEFVSMSYRPRPLNASWAGSEKLTGPFVNTRRGLAWARTKDDLGYLNVYALSDWNLQCEFDQALESLADSWGLVIDLRFNGGGDELLARKLAGRFLDETRVYSTNRYRAGPGHDELGPLLERPCEPRGPWRYEAPVVVLTGQRTMSSAESLVLMLAQCPQVTTLGDRSAGSSANPRLLELPGDIAVNLPRWLDMDPEQRPIDGQGVAPDVPLETGDDDFDEQHDAVLAAALERLRDTPRRERREARASR